MKKIDGKWIFVLLWYIYEYEVIRFNELIVSINKFTDKILSNRLNEQVNDRFVHKEVFKQIPPKVENSLTDHWKTMVPIYENVV